MFTAICDVNDEWEIVDGSCVKLLNADTPQSWASCAQICRDLGPFTHLLTLEGGYDETIWGNFLDNESEESVWIGVGRFTIGNANLFLS